MMAWRKHLPLFIFALLCTHICAQKLDESPRGELNGFGYEGMTGTTETVDIEKKEAQEIGEVCPVNIWRKFQLTLLIFH